MKNIDLPPEELALVLIEAKASYEQKYGYYHITQLVNLTAKVMCFEYKNMYFEIIKN